MIKSYRNVFKTLFLLVLAIPVFTLNAQNTEEGPAVNISIKAVPGLQFDLVRFKVKPGSRVTISLTNTDDMSHNLLITKPGTRLQVVNTALQLAEKGPQMNYIPKSDQVLWSIPVVSPGQVKSVTFIAPSKPGVYPYVCTYPGHGFLMYGAMYVMQEGALPDIKKDVNIPEPRRQDSTVNEKAVHADHQQKAISPHPYELIPPYMYRVFIEGSSPAGIAVSLPAELSYCWDAGTCKLRYAWKGGFIDNTDLWKGHFDASAKVLGDIFYRDNIEYPFRLGKNNALPEIKFKGYRLVNRYPEFHYTINGLDVYELIRAKADGYGLVREFRIPGANQDVWFYTNHQDDAIRYESSTGKWEGGRLELSAEQAKVFTITMTSYHLVYQRKKK
jgi:azurin